MSRIIISPRYIMRSSYMLKTPRSPSRLKSFVIGNQTKYQSDCYRNGPKSDMVPLFRAAYRVCRQSRKHDEKP